MIPCPVDCQKLTAPDGAIAAIASPIPSNAEHRPIETIVDHAGEHMGKVVRHLRTRGPNAIGKMRAVIVRVLIAGDEFRLRRRKAPSSP